eukprot:3341160-Pleurochrysis_carterae.AAC.5
MKRSHRALECRAFGSGDWKVHIVVQRFLSAAIVACSLLAAASTCRPCRASAWRARPISRARFRSGTCN